MSNILHEYAVESELRRMRESEENKKLREDLKLELMRYRLNKDKGNTKLADKYKKNLHDHTNWRTHAPRDIDSAMKHRKRYITGGSLAGALTAGSITWGGGLFDKNSGKAKKVIGGLGVALGAGIGGRYLDPKLEKRSAIEKARERKRILEELSDELDYESKYRR